MITLQPGDIAPTFEGIDQDGKIVTLKEYLGNKVALYFYPKDMTPTCTIQACNLRDNINELQKRNIKIIGVSVDDVSKHKKFEIKNQLPFTLIADTDHHINDAYGVWQLKKFMGKEYMGTVRTTFLINEKGYIDHIILKPTSKNHAQEILDLWKI